VNAREVAYRTLLRIDHEGAYANLVLRGALERSGLDGRDRRFVTELVNGTTRMRRACDALIDRFVVRQPAPEVRTLLRLGAYQVAFAGVPVHAAVAETVALAPKRQRGFVNAVLRRVASTPMVAWPSDAVRLSSPDWILRRLATDLGEADALAALAAMNEPPPVTARADSYVQDEGSQWVAAAVGAQPGERVLDVCAAPGGKATAIAATGAFVVAADVSPGRAGLIIANTRFLSRPDGRFDADGATRVGGPVDAEPDVSRGDGRFDAQGATRSGGVGVVVADGTAPPHPPATFDRVLLDAPCSGLGTLRRRADARWRITEADVDDLTALQRRLLTAAADLVRPGGVLVYSVCTLLAAESIDHATPDGFDVDTAAPPGPWEPWAHGWRLLPHRTGTDGMVVLRYRRRP
jgi:16S rRNA (cytosine967-C5)-methyltransferase